MKSCIAVLVLTVLVKNGVEAGLKCFKVTPKGNSKPNLADVEADLAPVEGLVGDISTIGMRPDDVMMLKDVLANAHIKYNVTFADQTMSLEATVGNNTDTFLGTFGDLYDLTQGVPIDGAAIKVKIGELIGLESKLNSFTNSDIALTPTFVIENAGFLADVAALIAKLTFYSIFPDGLADYLQNDFKTTWPSIVAQTLAAYGTA